MKNTLFCLLGMFLLAGCGGGAHLKAAVGSGAYAELEDAEESIQAPAKGALFAPAPPAAERPMDPQFAANDETPPLLERAAKQQPAETRPGTEDPPVQAESPRIIYNGYLRLRIPRLLEAVDEISAVAEEKGGYVESLSGNLVVVRVPRDDFEAVMSIFAKLGDLLDREIRATEVTEQYMDLKARLAVAKEARERLLKLLEEATKPKHRLAILEEIKRLTEQIESIKSTLSTLQNLLAFSTITIDLVPIIDVAPTEVRRSPFPWIRALSAHRVTLRNGASEFEIALPEDFVLFSEDEDYRAQAADTTVVRGGLVENDPVGTNEFWQAALEYEMEGRGEILVDRGRAGPMRYLLYKSNDVNPRWYAVAIAVQDDQIYVVEVFFPDEESLEAHREDIVKALGTFEAN